MIDKKVTVCFSGHREMEKDFNAEYLYDLISSYIKKGMKNFLCGMAIGFDMLVFKILEQLKVKNDIKIIACVPCKNQSERYSKEQKAEYDKMLKNADEVIVLSDNYTPYCMMKRNKYMVDNSSVLIVYYRQKAGGTLNTLKYALENDLKIEYV